MAKFRIELDGPPGQGVIVQDGNVLLDLTQFSVLLDAPSGQNFVQLSRVFPDGTFVSCQDITKATLLIETTQEA